MKVVFIPAFSCDAHRHSGVSLAAIDAEARLLQNPGFVRSAAFEAKCAQQPLLFSSKIGLIVDSVIAHISSNALKVTCQHV